MEGVNDDNGADGDEEGRMDDQIRTTEFLLGVGDVGDGC